jgi:hypothetical protein
MSRRSFRSASAAMILLALAAGCADQPPGAPPPGTAVQASPTLPKAGKTAGRREVAPPGPSTTMAPD